VVPGARLPPGYNEIAAILITPGRSVRIQVFSVLLALSVLAVLLLAARITSISISPAGLLPLLAVLAGTVGVVFLHEAVHGLVFLLSGTRPRFDAAILHGMPVLSTGADRPHGRDTALLGLLAPLVLIDGALLGLSAAFPTLLPWVIGPVVFNTAGSAGDLWLAARLARFGSSVLVADVPDGLVVYGPSGQKGASNR